MEKSPEQIREYFINSFGLELPIEKCTTYLTAYNTIARLTTVNLVRVVNKKLLEEVAGSENDFELASESGVQIDKHIIKSFYFRYFMKINAKEKEDVIDMEENKDVINEPVKQEDVKRNKINEFLSILGLEAEEEFYMQLRDLSLETLNDMDEIKFITYIIENDKSDFISIKDGEQSKMRSFLKNIPFGIRDKVVGKLFPQKFESLRGFEEEDKFINKLKEIGVYITGIDSSAMEIRSLEDLEKAIKDKHLDLVLGTSIGVKGTLDNKKNINTLVKMIKESFYEKEKAAKQEKNNVQEDYQKKLEQAEEEVMEWNPELPELLDDPIFEIETLVGEPQIKTERTPKVNSDAKNTPEIKPETENNPKSEPMDNPVPEAINVYTLEINTVNGKDISKDKEHMDAMLKQNYMLYGKDGLTKSFEQYIDKKGRISKINVETDSYEYNNEEEDNIALKVLNAKYIEHVLKNAKDIEYNFDLNPKARRLGEAIIAMYSKLKAANLDETSIMDQINDALTKGIINRDLNGFDVIKEPLKGKNTINIANDRVIDKEEFAQKRLELGYLSSTDIVNIMVSTELNNLFEREEKEAQEEGRKVVLKCSQLDELLDKYNKNNDNTQIATHKRMKNLTHENKSTEEANARAQKTQLLQYVAEHKNSFRPALDIPSEVNCKDNALEIENAIKESLVDFIKIKGEIETLRSEITNKKIIGEEVNNEEEMLKSLLNVYFGKYENEETKKLYSTYIAVNEIVKKHEKLKQKSSDREP